MSKEMDIRKDCCNIWNNLKDKTQMIDYLIESKQQIADLEAKLAEKETRIAELEDKDWYEATIKQLEKQNERLIKERDGNYENYSICWKENEKLKQQLAEKEEELKEFKSIGATPRQLQRAYQERYKYNERCSELKKQHIQNKINFAVSYLEIIKAFIIDKEFYFTGEDYSTVYVEDITEEIDNQIKELKEMK